MGFEVSGTFTKVIPNVRIEFSFGDKRSLTVEFLASDELVTVRETFDAEASHCAARQQQSWQAILGNFARHVYANE